MSNFSSKTKYVEARPRREKKLGRGGSVVSVTASSGGSGVSKSYVDSNFVTIATEQAISGAKDFVGGIKVNGMPITYNAEKKCWEFKGDFVVTGAITMFGSLSGFQPSTVTEAVEVDGETIVKTKNSQGQWQLTAIGRGSGSGGGISAAEVNILIENALKPYIKIETADDKYALISTVSGINSRLSAVETFFATEDSDTLINKWSEIVAFLNATEGDTLDNILATKANQSALDTAVASLTAEIGKKWTQNDAKISNWDSAYGWGDHANAGYAAKTYVDAELEKYVKLATAQSIEAQHNFVNGLQIGGLPITKSASANNTIYLDANLVVSGAITMFGSGSTTFPTIWANIPFNLEHMSWDGSQWNVIVEGGSGSGSLDTNAVNALIYDYLTQNSYATISDISSALVGYATQGWVRDNYLSKSGGTVSGSFRAFEVKRTDEIGSFVAFSNNTGYMGSLGFRDTDMPGFFDSAGSAYFLIHSGNIGQQSVNRAASAGAADSVSVTPVTESGNYSLALLPSSSTRTQGVCVGNNHRALFNPSTGALTATSFVGNLTGNADSADVLKKSFANENINYGTGDGLKLIYCHSNPGNFASAWQSGISVLTDYTGWQLTSYGGNVENPYFRSLQDNGVWKPWRQLAFLDSDVLSPSSGSLRVNGEMEMGTSAGGARFMFDNIAGQNRAVLILDPIGDVGYGEDYFSIIQFADKSAQLSNSITDITLTANGNVAIGGTTADAKLHVHGNTRVDGELYVNNKTILHLDTSNTWVNYGGSNDGLNLRLCGRELIFQYGRGDAFTRAMTITSDGNVAIGRDSAYAKLHVLNNILIEGSNPYLWLKDDKNRDWFIQYYDDYLGLGLGFSNSVKIDSVGNLIVPGAITMFSQLSMKNVIDYDGLSLEQLAQIKPARFTWKDGRDTLVHAGGIADEVMQVLPEVVYRTKDDKLTMDYGSAGFFMAASLIKPVIDHEQRLQSAEKEIKDLKAENKRLREQLRAS